jgi:hypothetical protein
VHALPRALTATALRHVLAAVPSPSVLTTEQWHAQPVNLSRKAMYPRAESEFLRWLTESLQNPSESEMGRM